MGAHMYMLSHALVMLCHALRTGARIVGIEFSLILPDWNCMLFESQLFGIKGITTCLGSSPCNYINTKSVLGCIAWVVMPMWYICV